MEVAVDELAVVGVHKNLEGPVDKLTEAVGHKNLSATVDKSVEGGEHKNFEVEVKPGVLGCVKPCSDQHMTHLQVLTQQNQNHSQV